MVEILESHLSLIQFYRDNPVIALKDLLDIELAIPQRVIFKDMWFNKFVIQTASRGTGKSYLCAAFACLYAMLYPGTRIGLLAPSFRQCVTGDSYVFSQDGMVRVDSLIERPVKLCSSTGLEVCSAMFKNPAEKVVRLKLSNGINLGGALDHRILMIDGCGDVVYKELDRLKVGDYICLKQGSMCFGNYTNIQEYREKFVSGGNLKKENIPEELNEELSYFIGLLIGDGCLTRKDYIVFYNGNKSIFNSYVDTCTKYFNAPSIFVRDDGVYRACKGTKLGYEFLNSIGIAGFKAKNKVIPEIILKSTLKNQAALIRGLFDTDGNVYFNPEISHKYKVSFCSISSELVKQLQLMLLNFGIESSININCFQKRNDLYNLEISRKKSIILFHKFIGFFCDYKKKTLETVVSYILDNTNKDRSNKDFIPSFGKKLESLVSLIRSRGKTPFEYLRLWKYFDNNSFFIGGEKSITYNFLNKLVKYCELNDIYCSELDSVKKVIDDNYLYVKIKDKEYGFDYTYDFTVNEVHNYLSNGIISHNSKLMFEEVKTIWNKSSIFREATNGRPTMQSDRCVLTLKNVGGRPHSLIESDPLGTGEKIRGIRMHVLLIDEFAQMPEEIFDAVIKPMAATYSSPMENVRRLEHIRRLKAAGADVTALEGDSSVNKIIVVSSAFYKFNHMYKRIQNYERLIASGKPGYALRNTNYLDMPPGFMNEDIINEAKETMPQSVFRMEYLSVWESDSEGVFKASLLEACRLPFSEENSVKMFSEDDKEYVVGCDPARTTDAFALVIIELGKKNKVVNAYKHTEITFPQMADALVSVCERYNVIRVVIDSQGGGNAIKDLVCDTVKYGNKALIDIDDPNMVGVDGKRILQLVNPSPKFNADANYSTLSLLEHGKMFFPCRPIGGNEAEEGAYEIIDEMISQMRNIVVTETRSGVAHFDVPVGGGHGKQKKDLYSAMIYASNKISEMENEGTLPDKIIWGSGVIVPISSKVKNTVEPVKVAPFAVLTKK